jgi:hypothetical protein
MFLEDANGKGIRIYLQYIYIRVKIAIRINKYEKER